MIGMRMRDHDLGETLHVILFEQRHDGITVLDVSAVDQDEFSILLQQAGIALSDIEHTYRESFPLFASLLFAFEAAEDEAAAPPPQPAAARATVRVSTMARRYFQICLMDNI